MRDPNAPRYADGCVEVANPPCSGFDELGIQRTSTASTFFLSCCGCYLFHDCWFQLLLDRYNFSEYDQKFSSKGIQRLMIILL